MGPDPDPKCDRGVQAGGRIDGQGRLGAAGDRLRGVNALRRASASNSLLPLIFAVGRPWSALVLRGLCSGHLVLCFAWKWAFEGAVVQVHPSIPWCDTRKR